MEEDNEDITGWDDNEIKILDSRTLKKYKKKLFQTPTIDKRAQRKLQPSHTLPVIKNPKHSLPEPIVDIKHKKEDSNIDKLLDTIENRIKQIQKANRTKDYIKLNCHDLLLLDKQNDKQLPIDTCIPEQENFLVPKRRRVKHALTVVKEDKESNFQQLKVQANQYCSTQRISSIQEKSRSKDMVMKISKNSSSIFSKKQKSKYFIVKKQLISPLKKSQDISKIAVQGVKSNDQQGTMISQQKSTKIFKQRYKNIIINTIESDRQSSSSFLQPKILQTKKYTHQRRNTNAEGQIVIEDKCHRLKQKMNKITALRESTLNESVVLNLNDDKKRKRKVIQLNKIFEEQEKISRKIKLGKQKSLKMLRTSSQTNPSQMMQESNKQKSQNLTLLLTNKMKDIPLNKSIKLRKIKQVLREKSIKEGSQKIINVKNVFTLKQTQGINQFSDQCLFIRR